MRLKEFIEYVADDNQFLHIECARVPDIYFDGTKAELLDTYDEDSDPDILWLWLNSVTADGDCLNIVVEY